MVKIRYQPSEEDRRKVKTLAGFGIPHKQIGVLMDLRSPKTLRRYFSKELKLGIVESSTSVMQSLFKSAASGRHPAMTSFYLKTRAGWGPGMTLKREAEEDEQLIFVYEDYEVPAE